MSIDEPKIDVLVNEYIDLRNDLTDKRKAFKQFEVEIKSRLITLEAILLQKADELGVEGFPTKKGVAYKTTKTYVRVSNFDDVIAFVKETDNFQVFEKRVAKLACIEIMDHIKMPVPGTEYEEERVILVRKPTK